MRREHGRLRVKAKGSVADLEEESGMRTGQDIVVVRGMMTG